MTAAGPAQPLCGLLNIYKPAGPTSREVVDRVARLVRPSKAGHAGTLDPLAEGVLVVCVGRATRLIEYVQRMPKRYRGTFLLGRSSDTEDVEGQVAELVDPPRPAADAVLAAGAKFVGTIMQRPPAYSALKVAGQRAYDLARKGHAVELAPRPITIYALRVVAYDYPELTLDIECGSGTYVRSLGRDLAESLGSSAVMSALTRTAIGCFTVENALPLTDLNAGNLVRHLLPSETALATLPRLALSPIEAQRIARGQFITRSGADAAEYAAFDSHERLVAVIENRADGQLGARCNFV